MRATNRLRAGLEHPERALSSRRREGAIEGGQVFLAQHDIESATIFPNMLGARRLGYHDRAVPPQEPREGDLRRRRVPSAGDLGQRTVAEHAALAERGVSHDRDAAFAAP